MAEAVDTRKLNDHESSCLCMQNFAPVTLSLVHFFEKRREMSRPKSIYKGFKPRIKLMLPVEFRWRRQILWYLARPQSIFFGNRSK
jgi:hypothetical protein